MIFKNLFKKFKGKEKKVVNKHPEKNYSKVNDNTLIEHKLSSDELNKMNSMKIEVDIYVSGEKISTAKLDKNFIRVGRDPSQVDIIVAEPIISKVHCTFERAGSEIFITDNNSTNGVYINSIKTVKQQLKDGDIISLGKKGTVQLVIHKEVFL